MAQVLLAFNLLPFPLNYTGKFTMFLPRIYSRLSGKCHYNQTLAPCRDFRPTMNVLHVGSDGFPQNHQLFGNLLIVRPLAHP